MREDGQDAVGPSESRRGCRTMQRRSAWVGGRNVSGAASVCACGACERGGGGLPRRTDGMLDTAGTWRSVVPFQRLLVFPSLPRLTPRLGGAGGTCIIRTWMLRETTGVLRDARSRQMSDTTATHLQAPRRAAWYPTSSTAATTELSLKGKRDRGWGQQLRVRMASAAEAPSPGCAGCPLACMPCSALATRDDCVPYR